MASSGANSHVVGVDKTRGIIYDPHESTTFPFFRDNFNLCCSGEEICAGLEAALEIIVNTSEVSNN